jgi:hypothetical protein
MVGTSEPDFLEKLLFYKKKVYVDWYDSIKSVPHSERNGPQLVTLNAIKCKKLHCTRLEIYKNDPKKYPIKGEQRWNYWKGQGPKKNAIKIVLKGPFHTI